MKNLIGIKLSHERFFPDLISLFLAIHQSSTSFVTSGSFEIRRNNCGRYLSTTLIELMLSLKECKQWGWIFLEDRKYRYSLIWMGARL